MGAPRFRKNRNFFDFLDSFESKISKINLRNFFFESRHSRQFLSKLAIFDEVRLRRAGKFLPRQKCDIYCHRLVATGAWPRRGGHFFRKISKLNFSKFFDFFRNFSSHDESRDFVVTREVAIS